METTSAFCEEWTFCKNTVKNSDSFSRFFRVVLCYFWFQFVEMLVRNLKEALKTGEYDNAKLIVSVLDKFRFYHI